MLPQIGTASSRLFTHSALPPPSDYQVGKGVATPSEDCLSVAGWLTRSHASQESNKAAVKRGSNADLDLTCLKTGPAPRGDLRRHIGSCGALDER